MLEELRQEGGLRQSALAANPVSISAMGHWVISVLIPDR
jgi:hypothetical protein